MAQSLGDKIRYWLEVREMRPAELSRLSGVSRGLISDLLNNKRTTTTIQTIQKISRVLRVPPRYFMEDFEEADLAAEHDNIDPELWLFWEAVKKDPRLKLFFRDLPRLASDDIEDILRITRKYLEASEKGK